jgi:arylsulfatase A-like enzyme
MSMKRPNFVIFMSDQQRADYLGCYGHPFVKTPAIDTMAARGTAFDRFYVSSPVCMPNRATFMTGRLPSVHGARSNGIPLSLQANTFVDLLRAKGYRTALVGKSHLMTMKDEAPNWFPETPEGLEPPDGALADAEKPWADADAYEQENERRWEDDPDRELVLPFYGFERVHLCTGHGDRVGGEYVRWLRDRGYDRRKLIGPDNALPSDIKCPQAWRTALPEEAYPTAYIRDHSRQVLRDFKERDGDTPFFLMVSFPDPHHPFTPPGKYWDMYDPEQVTLPNSYYARANADSPARLLREDREAATVNRGRVMVFLPADEREAKEAAALTCGMITMIDDAIAAVLDELDAQGLADDTVVLFTADHGDFLGDHGMMLKGPLHMNSIIRVPFIWSDPMKKGVERCGAVAGTIDLAATILARAGLAGYNGLQGRNLLPDIATGTDHGPGFHMVEEEAQNPFLELPAPSRVRTLVTDEWRMSVYERNYAELYNLKSDPDELVNLWDDPEHADVRADLLVKLVRAGIDAIDRSPVPRHRA